MSATELEHHVPKTHRLITASTVLAWICPALFLVAAVLALKPVSNPGVQNCGAPLSWMLRGTPDAPLFTESGEALHRWNDDQLRRAHDNRCSAKVADRMLPAGIVFTVFLVTGLGAFILLWAGRRSTRVRLRHLSSSHSP